MFEQLGKGFTQARQRLAGKATLDEKNIAEALVLVEESLLAADVSYPVVKSFLAAVKDKALGTEVSLKAVRALGGSL